MSLKQTPPRKSPEAPGAPPPGLSLGQRYPFMLDTEPVMTRFIKTMTRINSGRIFFADPSRLGEYLIVDYVKNRRSAG